MKRVQEIVRSVTAMLSWLPPLLARVTVGVVFLQSGWGKLHNLQSVIEFFSSLGIPAPQLQAPIVSGLELVCGALILIGLLTRLAALPLMGTMVVAIATAKLKDLTGFTDLFGTSEFLYIVLLVWLATAGAGAISIDRWFGQRALGHQA